MSNLPIDTQSADAKFAAVKGECIAGGGFGIWGVCNTGHGVHGDSQSSRGVVGTSQTFHGVYGKSVENVGVAGESDKMNGVLGICHGAGAGVMGSNDKGGDGVVGTGRRGVVGLSNDYQGVFGKSVENAGVVGESDKLHGVFGICHSPHGAGVFGASDTTGSGVEGSAKTGAGVYAHSEGGAGIFAESRTGFAIHGKGDRLAGFFEGDVEVTGDIRLANADCAEDFDIAGAAAVEAGTVMVLDAQGALAQSSEAYDKRVVGVVSGAGAYKPGIVLDRHASRTNRQPIALMGKVYCKVDASFGAVAAGDLLTTSSTPGHAMKIRDALQGFGAVIGKALRPLAQGQALVPILVALQ